MLAENPLNDRLLRLVEEQPFSNPVQDDTALEKAKLLINEYCLEVPSSAFPGTTPVALGSGVSLGGSGAFLPSSAFPGTAPVALGAGASLGSSGGFLPSSGPAGGGAPGTGARNAPFRGFSFLAAILCSSYFQIMSKNASRLETHYQPVLGAEIILYCRLIVIIDGRWGVV